eukprot:802129-Pelagomonas_calceolata.AAC.2
MAGVDVEGLPMLDDIEIMKRLDSRGRELQAQLKDKYLAHVYHSEWGLGLSGTCVWQCMGCGFEFVCIQGKMMTSVTCACKEKNGCGGWSAEDIRIQALTTNFVCMQTDDLIMAWSGFTPCDTMLYHLQERSLRRPEALEHAVTSAQGVDASRPASVGQSRGAGPCASLPSVEERRGSSRGRWRLPVART